MALTASGYVNEAEIDSAIRDVENKFSPQVVRIGRTFREDHYDFPSVFFRILVRDEVASPAERLLELAQPLSIALMNEARTHENGLHAYFSFRSVSEQQKLQDPDWE